MTSLEIWCLLCYGCKTFNTYDLHGRQAFNTYDLHGRQAFNIYDLHGRQVLLTFSFVFIYLILQQGAGYILQQGAGYILQEIQTGH